MKSLYLFAVLAGLLTAPCFAQSQSLRIEVEPNAVRFFEYEPQVRVMRGNSNMIYADNFFNMTDETDDLHLRLRTAAIKFVEEFPGARGRIAAITWLQNQMRSELDEYLSKVRHCHPNGNFLQVYFGAQYEENIYGDWSEDLSLVVLNTLGSSTGLRLGREFGIGMMSPMTPAQKHRFIISLRAKARKALAESLAGHAPCSSPAANPGV